MPGKKGKPAKYLLPAGSALVLDVHPATPASWFTDAPTVVLAEGLLKADSALTTMLLDAGITHEEVLQPRDDEPVAAREALRSLMEAVPAEKRVLIIGLVGSGNFHQNPDWNTLALRGRSVWVALDADVAKNDNVWKQADSLVRFFESPSKKAAEVHLVKVPAVAGDPKAGLDDFFGEGGRWAAVQGMLGAMSARPEMEVIATAGRVAEVRIDEGATVAIVKKDIDGEATEVKQVIAEAAVVIEKVETVRGAVEGMKEDSAISGRVSWQTRYAGGTEVKQHNFAGIPLAALIGRSVSRATFLAAATGGQAAGAVIARKHESDVLDAWRESVDRATPIETDHWACAVTNDGAKIWNKTLPNDEAKLVTLYQQLSAKGRVLVVVDQPATIGALAVAVAQNQGTPVAYLPGLTMRRIADMYPGSAKTDERDAFIIAEAARTMPHTLRGLQVSDENEATLGMLTGFDLDLARQITQTVNRIRGLFTQIHPPLEKVLGPWLEHDAVLQVLAAWPTPAQLRRAGQARIAAKLKKHGARRHHAWAQALLDAVAAQSVTVVGTDAAGLVIPHLATQLISLHAQRRDVAEHLEQLVADHPLYPVLTSMPGVAVRTAAVIIAETSGKTFLSAAALAAYAGLAPTTRQSGTSIRSERVSHAGNKRLKRALFLSAFASIRSDPISRAYYDRKRGQGKRHNQALIALAHRRLTVLFAMIRDGSYYDQPQPSAA